MDTIVNVGRVLSLQYLFRTMSTYNFAIMFFLTQYVAINSYLQKIRQNKICLRIFKLLQLCQKVDIAFAPIVGRSVTQGICCSIQVLIRRFEVSPLIQIHPMRACCNCFQTITVSQTKLVFLLFLFPISSQSQGNEITAPIRNRLFEGIFYVLQYTFPNLFNLKFIQMICRP